MSAQWWHHVRPSATHSRSDCPYPGKAYFSTDTCTSASSTYVLIPGLLVLLIYRIIVSSCDLPTAILNEYIGMQIWTIYKLHASERMRIYIAGWRIYWHPDKKRCSKLLITIPVTNICHPTALRDARCTYASSE